MHKRAAHESGRKIRGEEQDEEQKRDGAGITSRWVLVLCILCHEDEDAMQQ